MNLFQKLSPELQQQIVATFAIQIEVFHYDKILMLAFDENDRIRAVLNSDKKKYKTLKIPP